MWFCSLATILICLKTCYIQKYAQHRQALSVCKLKPVFVHEYKRTIMTKQHSTSVTHTPVLFVGCFAMVMLYDLLFKINQRDALELIDNLNDFFRLLPEPSFIREKHDLTFLYRDLNHITPHTL